MKKEPNTIDKDKDKEKRPVVQNGKVQVPNEIFAN
jgi:hypothetical protein